MYYFFYFQINILHFIMCHQAFIEQDKNPKPVLRKHLVRRVRKRYKRYRTSLYRTYK